ncbi:MAG: DivIVA domain-containing protein [Algoriphagus sp.]|uniref:DivIVA domain-containing protein n=1 Tax=Algoriphagus sp. TaxID=1872435 RepID=UPI00272EF184|nr:DivIVA domain-containing protein [Algoriphagus sp.]MDP2042360.1 DivIVA domain-containing protein [Algoriphagus sp.]MDP3471120.1 DivIVA domain-containing protein [Algoriphagus sp.]
MKISPTAIRQKAFETAFRGYEKKEVSLFLEEMSVIMEQINQENLDLRSKLQQVESEAKRLKDVEDSLFRTLKTAEDTGASIITEANEAAELIINEANQFAEQSTDQANHYAEKTKKEANQYVERVTKEADQYFQKAQKQADEQARIITSAAEAKAKETIKEIRDSMQSLVRSYEGLLDQREALVKSLKRLSQDALNQIDLSDAHFFRIDGKAYQRAVDELSRSSHFSVANIGILATQAVPPANAEPEEQFEEDMSAAGLDEETLETVEALQHELEEQGEIPMDEPMEDLEEEESESVVDEILPEVEDEVEEDEVIEEQEEIEEEIPMREFPKHVTEDPKPEDLKKSSGSFFDQFD